MVKPRTNKVATSERGMALLVVLLALLLISAISLGLVVMSNSETNISANFRDEQVAFFGAKGGVEEVRDRLRGAAIDSLSLPPALPGTPGPNFGVLYITNPVGPKRLPPGTLRVATIPTMKSAKR